MTEQQQDTVSFGPFRLVPSRRSLEKAGVPVRLSDRAFDLLVILTRHAPEIVGKAALFDYAWSGVTVEEGNLRLQMNALRRALGDGEDGGAYIYTAHGRGYGFVAPLVRSHEPVLGSAPDASAPAAPTVSPSPTNLPQPPTGLIGRGEDLVRLGQHLGQHRILTLVGPGGIGKTRLALELGRQLLDNFAGGVWLVDLAPLGDPQLVVGAVAAVLGVVPHSAEAAIDSIADAIGKKPTLLVFDNCEQVIEAAAALIETLVKRAPGLSVLATSQETLRVPAEQVSRLEPLAVPPAGTGHIEGFGAVALFLERARSFDPRFTLNEGNAEGIAEICRNLDGIPLALEMAAARLPLLGVQGLRTGLGERLKLLKTGSRASLARHGTLQSMVDWSYGLLDEAERLLFRRMGVFAGSFSLDAALAMSEADRWDVVDTIGTLVDKSLVTIEAGEPPRYRLLETLRLHALEQLAAEGESAAIVERHATYFIGLFARYYAARYQIIETDWVAQLRAELDNVRAALDWTLATPDRQALAIELAATSAMLFNLLGHLSEVRRYLAQAEALIDGDTPPIAAARLLQQVGNLLTNSDRSRQIEVYERALALYQPEGDLIELGSLLGSLGGGYVMLGRLVDAEAALLEAERILILHNATGELGKVYGNLGIVAAEAAQTDKARMFFTRSLDLCRAAQENNRAITAIINLAELEFSAKAVDRAIDLGREAVAQLRSGKWRTLCIALDNLVSYLIARGDFDAARSFALEALPLQLENGGWNLQVGLLRWTLLGAIEGRCWEAARLLGYVQATYAKTGELLSPADRDTFERIPPLLRERMSEAEIQAQVAEGARWDGIVAAQFALDQLARQVPSASA